MARTILNQSTQVGASLTYTSSAPAGSTLQTGALSLNDDLNGLRVQVARLLDATSNTSWYSDVATVDGKKRSILQLNTSLDALETKTMLDSVSVTTSINVPSGQNYVILTVGSSQSPSLPAAVALTSIGAVVAQSAYSGTAFACNELAQITGSDAESPKNRTVVISASTKNVIETSDNDIYGLLQIESTASDGATFNDTTSGARVKISFVYFNQTSNAMVACPVSDIQGATIRYSYSARYAFANLPEDAFLRTGYVDQVAALDISLTRAVSNQAGVAVPVNYDVLWRVANGVNYKVQTSTGGKDLWAISPNASGNAAVLNTDTFAINTTSTVTSVKGASLATAAQAINIGVTNGQIDTTGALAIKSIGSNPLALSGGSTLTLTDGYEASSTWVSTSIPLASSATDWTAYKAQYGEVSLLAGVLKAGQMGSHGLYSAVVTATTIPAGTTVTGNGSSANLSVAFPNTSATPNLSTGGLKAFVNGTMQHLNDDFTLVSGSTTTDLVFTYALRGGTQPDRITIEVFGNPVDASGN